MQRENLQKIFHKKNCFVSHEEHRRIKILFAYKIKRYTEHSTFSFCTVQFLLDQIYFNMHYLKMDQVIKLNKTFCIYDIIVSLYIVDYACDYEIWNILKYFVWYEICCTVQNSFNYHIKIWFIWILIHFHFEIILNEEELY